MATPGIRCLGAWTRRRGEAIGDVGENMGKTAGKWKIFGFCRNPLGFTLDISGSYILKNVDVLKIKGPDNPTCYQLL